MKDNLTLHQYVRELTEHFPEFATLPPWSITRDIQAHLMTHLNALDSDYMMIKDDVAIHKNAVVEDGVILKGPIIICENVFIGAHAYLRGGVFLAPKVCIGPGCEIKSTIMMSRSSLAHFNFAGDSIIGSDVNFEAGSVIANHHNDRDEKTIFVFDGKDRWPTDVTKFGALVGDGSRIGANAVLSPGTILKPGSIVRRLQLVQDS